MKERMLKSFKERIRKLKYMEEALGVLHWDMRTGAPRKGLALRSEVVGMLSGEWFQLSTDDALGEMLEVLATKEALSEMNEIEQRLVQITKRDYERSRKIPHEQYEAYVVLTSKAEAKWEECKEASDFTTFQPYLEEIVAYQQSFARLWGSEGHLYHALLDEYEPGMSVDKLDAVFGELKEKIVPLLQEIQSSSYKPDNRIIKQSIDPC